MHRLAHGEDRLADIVPDPGDEHAEARGSKGDCDPSQPLRDGLGTILHDCCGHAAPIGEGQQSVQPLSRFGNSWQRYRLELLDDLRLLV